MSHKHWSYMVSLVVHKQVTIEGYLLRTVVEKRASRGLPLFFRGLREGSDFGMGKVYLDIYYPNCKHTLQSIGRQ